MAKEIKTPAERKKTATRVICLVLAAALLLSTLAAAILSQF